MGGGREERRVIRSTAQVSYSQIFQRSNPSGLDVFTPTLVSRIFYASFFVTPVFFALCNKFSTTLKLGVINLVFVDGGNEGEI